MWCGFDDDNIYIMHLINNINNKYASTKIKKQTIQFNVVVSASVRFSSHVEINFDLFHFVSSCRLCLI